jgi:DNA-binding MarR family transcriptional regulator
MRKAARLTTKFYDEAIAQSGLKITQYSLLRNLQRLGQTPIVVLADVLLLERTTLLRNLKILAREKLVEIIPPAGSRAHSIRLTERGEAELDKAAPVWRQAQQKIEGLLTEEEQKFIRELAQKLSTLALS